MEDIRKKKPITREWDGKPLVRPMKIIDLGSEKIRPSESGKKRVIKKCNDKIAFRPVREVELTSTQKNAVGKIIQTKEWINATSNEKRGILRAIRRSIK